MDIFNSSPGAVAVIDVGSTLPGTIQISSPKFPSDGSGSTVLISGVRYRQRTNHQFQSALDRQVYVYMFGDNMGTVEVQGMTLPDQCSGGGGVGAEAVLQYYDTNRASKLSTPIKVAVGKDVISGFLTEMDLHSVTGADEGSAHMMQFSLLISALPKEAA